ncbi:polyprenol phosphomannose-dependent alpha 1,6 mannosyltransferase MptB [Planobispora takensis]|uniref:Polyprenol phosphomannose-dependent alpha 1,6 mannosyltransferase MptB n=1 Tax=Planobispora takensis TaxID=1367882 RepID=A0A8J3T5H5_9ACTN|nr:polyprenol phosphomannose-dependent alpha 1,6 mannosyltransferase MptB [Planobispora takensis]GII04786.1 hypothetical protein Pta02_67940 [Planobispora takensis]
MTLDSAVAGKNTAPGSRDALGAFARWAMGVSVLLTILIGLLGPSAMVPGPAGPSWHPPYSLDAAPSGHLVIAMAALAVLLGGAGLGAALRSRWRPDPRWLLAAGSAAVALLAFLPPSGSPDHLNYAAYGRLAALGHDPYAVTPAELPDDPVTGSVEEWAGVTSVYGPVATVLQALASLAGGDSVRLTVFVMALFNAAAFIGTSLLIHRFTGGDDDLQRRAALLWAVNPLMIYHLSAGMHVDTLAVVCMIAALVALGAGRLTGGAGTAGAVDAVGAPPHGATGMVAGGRAGRRSGRLWPLLAASGLLLGAGIAVKLNAGLVALGPAWALRRSPRRLAVVAGTATAAVVVAYGLAGPHVLDQVGEAGKKVSLATPWQLVKIGLQSLFGPGAYTLWIQIGTMGLLAVLAWLLLRAASGAGITPGPRSGVIAPVPAPGGSIPGSGAGGTGVPLSAPAVAAVIVTAWLFAAPYALPWYDGLAFALLAMTASWPALEGFVVARTTILSLGYLPAREALRPDDLLWLKTVVRQQVVPWSLLALTAALVWWAARAAGRARRRPASAAPRR